MTSRYQMESKLSSEVNLHSHLVRMRVTAVAGLVVVVFASIAAFVLPYRGSAVASPRTVTLVALAASLWIGFSANRDATGRLTSFGNRTGVLGRLLYEEGENGERGQAKGGNCTKRSKPMGGSA